MPLIWGDVCFVVILVWEFFDVADKKFWEIIGRENIGAKQGYSSRSLQSLRSEFFLERFADSIPGRVQQWP